MNLIERNNKLNKKIDIAVNDIWENMGNVREKINPCIIEIQTVLKEFMDRVSEFQKLGVDIPMNVILEQLNNMVSGMEYGDMILLADTLEYEIKNTILFYTDILKAIENEKGEK